jgi:hypothetical protein
MHVSYIHPFPLSFKAMADCPSSIQLLCDHGASVNAKDIVSEFVSSHFCSCILSLHLERFVVLMFLYFSCCLGWADTACSGDSDV